MTKEEYIKQMKLINNNYFVIFSNEDDSKKYYIGKKNKKICRFCSESEPKVTFRTIAHAIPECLGNKNIICYDECDTCNKNFSENIEIHLDKITLRYRNINMIKGKKKIPSYKSNDKKIRIDVVNKEERLNQVIASQNSNSITFDKDKNILKQNYDIPSHVPSLAYKTLVKMALSIMDYSSLKDFNLLNIWIQDKQQELNLGFPLKVMFTFIPAINPLQKIFVYLFKNKNDKQEYFSHMFVLAFGNIMYQIGIPNDIEIIERKSKKMLKLLSPFEIEKNLGNIKHEILDWSQTTTVKSHSVSMTFSYDKIEKLSNLNGILLTDLPKNLNDLKKLNK